MSRKQYKPHGSSHEKKVSRKERKKMRAENPVTNTEGPLEVIAPNESDKKQLRNLTIVFVVVLVVLMFLMYYIFVSSN